MPDVQDIQKEVRKYLFVFAALLCLTLVNAAAHYLHLGTTKTIVLTLFIAVIQASLAAGFFLHLFSEKKLIYGILALTVFLVVMTFTIPFDERYGGKQGGKHLEGPGTQMIMPDEAREETSDVH